MTQFFDRVKMGVAAAPGTGTVTLGSAVSAYRSFDAAGVPDGAGVSYTIEDGDQWECGHGTYTASGTLMARTTVLGSSNANAAINASASAIVFLTLLAADLASISTAPPSKGAKVVQSVVAPNSQDARFANSPTKNNLLVAIGLHYHGGPIVPNGFIQLYDTNGSGDGYTVSYRTSDGTETDTVFGTNPPYTLAMWELSGVTASNMTQAGVLGSSTGIVLKSNAVGDLAIGICAIRNSTTAAAPTVPAGTTAGPTARSDDRVGSLWSSVTTQVGNVAYNGTFASGVDAYTIGVDLAASTS